jgi:phosphatidylglycerol:prolipoprotein diacylglycerol transferase
MRFPVYIPVLGHRLHPHAVMELLAYTGGFQLYLLLRRKWKGPVVPVEQNLWVIVGAIFGALVGSKILAWWESWPDYWRFWHLTHSLGMFAGGKTIVGGLLGGWVGVEAAKKILGIRFSTGDLYVFPLIVGMSIGRVGCFLTGLPDHTYGNYTNLPWAVDFGDGPRHPTQLYDIAFLLLFGIFLFFRMKRPHENGRIFRLFIFGYCLYRFSVEFLKPTYKHYLGLSAIQLACLTGAMVCGWLLYGRNTGSKVSLIAPAGRPGIER